jgi:DNA repair protein RecN (Recombination protein N)
MIELLRISNLALIDDLEIEFSSGLNVLTGETGAGKSFIMRAVGFLTGEKLAADMVRPGEEKARVEALFVLDGEEYVLRRELSAETGRSRVFINDSLSSQETVRELRPRLTLHTSQHGQQRLLQPAYHAELLDGFLGESSALAERDRLLAAARQARQERLELEEKVRGLAERRDLLEHQKAEIDKVSPEPGEEERLLERREALKGRAKALEAAERSLSILHGQGEGLLDLQGRLQREVEALGGIDPEYAEIADRLEELRQALSELDARLRREGPGGGGPDLEAVEARLFEFSSLKRKLGKGMEEILRLKDELESSLSLLDSHALDARRLEERERKLAAELGAAVDRLNEARREAAESLAATLTTELSGLGFSAETRVMFDFEAVEIFEGVHEDRPRILWLPNPGHSPQPLDRIASGGELSRFLLAMVALAARERLPTLIFDEVDAGVGGMTLNRLGEKLSDLAARQQVLLVTHWPQLACMAGRHFHVHKETRDGMARINCRRLGRNEIFGELSRMAGGGAKGEALARELLGG